MTSQCEAPAGHEPARAKDCTNSNFCDLSKQAAGRQPADHPRQRIAGAIQRHAERTATSNAQLPSGQKWGRP